MCKSMSIEFFPNREDAEAYAGKMQRLFPPPAVLRIQYQVKKTSYCHEVKILFEEVSGAEYAAWVGENQPECSSDYSSLIELYQDFLADLQVNK